MKNSITKKLHKCSNCGKKDDTVIKTEDPYQSEINDDHTTMYLCQECVHESSMEI